MPLRDGVKRALSTDPSMALAPLRASSAGWSVPVELVTCPGKASFPSVVAMSRQVMAPWSPIVDESEGWQLGEKEGERGRGRRKNG